MANLFRIKIQEVQNSEMFLTFFTVCNMYTRGELLLNMEFPGEQLELVSFRENRALLADKASK